MKLVNTYRIAEVHGTHYSKAPYHLLLESTAGPIPKEAGELVVDKATCERHGITPSLDLVDRLIRCTLTARTLKRTREIDDGHTFADTEDMSPDEMLLDCIRREEEWKALHNCSHDALRQNVRYFLRAYSDDGSDGMHVSAANCPLYTLTVELTQDEFHACTHLAPGTVLAARFELLTEESQANP